MLLLIVGGGKGAQLRLNFGENLTGELLIRGGGAAEELSGKLGNLGLSWLSGLGMARGGLSGDLVEELLGTGVQAG